MHTHKHIHMHVSNQWTEHNVMNCMLLLSMHAENHRYALCTTDYQSPRHYYTQNNINYNIRRHQPPPCIAVCVVPVAGLSA